MNQLLLDNYRPGDEAALQHVCIRTGDSGEDATDLYAHPELLHLVYLDPYLAHSPDLTFVLRNEDGAAVGYIVGVEDSHAFEDWCEGQWWPSLQKQWQEGSTPEGLRGEALILKIHNPGRTPEQTQQGWPAHLHIDILPEGQGGGNGRRLLNRFLDELTVRGVRGLHLGVGARNTNAQGFYRHVGFEVLLDHDWGAVMGMKLPRPTIDSQRDSGLPSGA